MRNYPSKLLLFGEHVLLLGHTALAIPVPRFSGKWAENGTAENDALARNLAAFANSDALRSLRTIDVERFGSEVAGGLAFESDIPIGYGLGSSGALCAAVYDRYCREKTADPVALKSLFSRMESFFHGSSSGIDPLTSYLNLPVIIRHQTEVEVTVKPERAGLPHIFLIDSGLPRQTGTLVRWFQEKCAEPLFYGNLQENYLPAHERMVQNWLDGDSADFWINLRQVSSFQFEYLTRMIPANMHDIWLKSIDSQDFALKICGAGGGGYMLGFCKDEASLEELKTEFKIIFPCSA